MNLITENKAMIIASGLMFAGFFFGYKAGEISGSKEGTSTSWASCRGSFQPRLDAAYACAPQCKPLPSGERCLKDATTLEEKEACYEE